MDTLSVTPSYTRFWVEAQASADLQAARLTHPVPRDFERCVRCVTQLCHESGFSIPTVDPYGNIVWVASTVAIPLEWRAHLHDCTVVYAVKERPTRFGILRVYVGDAGAVVAADPRP